MKKNRKIFLSMFASLAILLSTVVNYENINIFADYNVNNYPTCESAGDKCKPYKDSEMYKLIQKGGNGVVPTNKEDTMTWNDGKYIYFETTYDYDVNVTLYFPIDITVSKNDFEGLAEKALASKMEINGFVIYKHKKGDDRFKKLDNFMAIKNAAGSVNKEGYYPIKLEETSSPVGFNIIYYIYIDNGEGPYPELSTFDENIEVGTIKTYNPIDKDKVTGKASFEPGKSKQVVSNDKLKYTIKDENGRAVNEVNPNKVGKYTITYELTDFLGRTVTKTKNVIVEDKRPTLTEVNPETPKEIVIGDTTNPKDFVEATDHYGNPIDKDKIEIKNPEVLDQPGDQTVIYVVTDKDGRESEPLEVIVKVKELEVTIDATDKVIELNDKFEPLKDVSAKGTDGKDYTANLVPTSSVDTTKPGVYDVVYEVIVDGKVIGTKTITVTVEDKRPTLTEVNPETPKEIIIGDTTNPKDFVEATDHDGNSIDKDKIEIKNPEVLDQPGDQTVIYVVTDKDGRESEPLEVIVKVKELEVTIDATDKVIELNDKFEPLKDVSAKGTDGKDYTADLVPTSSVDTTKPGVYDVVYEVIVDGKVIGTKTITVTVEDKRPTLTEVNPETPKEIVIGDTTNPKDFVEATDHDGNSIDKDKIEIKNPEVLDQPGDQTVIYVVTDKDGRESEPLEVIVKVKELEVTIDATDKVIELNDKFEPLKDVSAKGTDGKDYTADLVPTSSVDTTKPGVYDVVYEVIVDGKVIGTKTITVTVEDKRPTLTEVNPETPKEIIIGDTTNPKDFVEATDHDGNPIDKDKIEIKNPEVLDQPGDQTVIYVVTDKDGRESEPLEVIVKVKELEVTIDATDKVIELNDKFEPLKDVSAKGTDGKDYTADLVPTSSVDTTKPGVYDVVYEVIVDGKVIGTKTITVTVEDKRPTLTEVNPETPKEIIIGDTTNPKDFVEATDHDGNPIDKDKIEIKNPEVLDQPGDQTVIYVVTDKDGRESEPLEVIVKVKELEVTIDATDKVIELNDKFDSLKEVSAKGTDGKDYTANLVPTSSVDTTKPGVYDVVYEVIVDGKVIGTKTITVTVEDKRPTLTEVNPETPKEIIIGDTTNPKDFVEATDHDGNPIDKDKIEIKNPEVLDQPGDQTVIYVVTDKDGRESEPLEVIVKVKELEVTIDATDKVIELNEKFDPLKEVSAKGTDGKDYTANLVPTSSVDTTKPGIYDVVYEVIVDGKVIGTKTITVTVEDKRPTLTEVNPDKPKEVIIGDTTNPKDFVEATDHDGNPIDKDKIEIKNPEVLDKPGDQTVIYVVSDKDGRESEPLEVIVKVKELEVTIDATDKVIELNEKFDPLKEVSAKGTDGKDYTANLVPTSSVDTTKPGIYDVVYEVIVDGKVIGTKTITVTVEDKRPTLTEVNPETPKEIVIGDTTNPKDFVEATDHDGNPIDKDKIEIKNPEVLDQPGDQTVIYVVTDKDGRESEPIEVIVKVKELEVTIDATDKVIELNDEFDPLKDVSAKGTDGKDYTADLVPTSNVDTTKPGVYDVVYEVIVDGKVIGTKTITVTVEDKRPTLTDNNTSRKLKNKDSETFNPLDYVDAYDYLGNKIEKKFIVFENTLDFENPGYQTITYYVIDSSGRVSDRLTLEFIVEQVEVLGVKKPEKSKELKSKEKEVEGKILPTTGVDNDNIPVGIILLGAVLVIISMKNKSNNKNEDY